MMKGVSNCPKKKLRAQKIASILNSQKDIDIICLQKVFDRNRARNLKKDLIKKYPYIYWDNDCKVGFTSGLFIASKIAITLKDSLNFKAAKGFEKFAPKGAMIFEGEIGGKKFQVLNIQLNTPSQPTDNGF